MRDEQGEKMMEKRFYRKKNMLGKQKRENFDQGMRLTEKSKQNPDEKT